MTEGPVILIHPACAGYEKMAAELTGPYEALAFEDVHAAWIDLIPEQPSDILDIVAGTGRDAAHLAFRGHRVMAVDPTPHLAGLRRRGGRLLISLRHGPSPAVRPMYAVAASDVISGGKAAGLTLIRRKKMESIQSGNRALGITWTMLAFSS
ncbi:MAG: hypothetical protein CMN55_03220 [Sneathiella sp.]|jgi:SAM-dependent methyltransferase|uniref:class I SAM-dependent methyltransferase n=1 Tax=Sneathiella sp. TaxID=1964365 RepID=UPI000C613E24|nr:hypothetical protein [Sneathiella sp.]MAL78116.1 hypothetical protein [Sneathiella sp.]|tara:strand:- start:194 stop:649 length:456 start_codon:yes stop_codon:yes gene_type:complete